MDLNKELKPHVAAAIITGIFGVPPLILILVSGEASVGSLALILVMFGLLFLLMTGVFLLISKYGNKLKSQRPVGLNFTGRVDSAQHRDKLTKEEAEKLYSDAQDAFRRGVYAKAAEALRPLVAQYPENEAVLQAWQKVSEKLDKSTLTESGQEPRRSNNEVEDFVESPVEVRTQHGELLKFDNLSSLRRSLLNGTVTRFDYVRESVKETTDEADDYELRAYERAERRKRQAWRQIGGSVAKERMSILRLYDPRRYYWKLALICLLVPLSFAAVTFGFGKAMPALEANEITVSGNPAMPGIYDSPVIMILMALFVRMLFYIIPSMLGAALLGWALSYPVGALFYRLCAWSLPVPPPDGYDIVKLKVDKVNGVLQCYDDDRELRRSWRKANTDTERYAALRKTGMNDAWPEQLEQLLPSSYRIRLPEDLRVPYASVDKVPQ